MGREAQAQVTFRGTTAVTKLLLEGTELILRGGHKARFPRASLDHVTAGADGLALRANGEELLVALSTAEADRWVKAILTPPPSLARKLGIDANHCALVIGPIDDPDLSAALAGAIAVDLTSAKSLLAVIENNTDLAAATAHALATGLPLWCVYPKGKDAEPGGAAIRALLRDAGLTDTKSCAVSARLTATRYGQNAELS